MHILCCDEERFRFVFFDVTTPSSLFRYETVQSVGMENGSVYLFGSNKLYLLGWSTVEFCLFRCNNAEFAVQMGNGSVCWDGERFSLVFFDVTMQSSLLIWGTVQSCLFRGNNAEFSVAMGNGSDLFFSM